MASKTGDQITAGDTFKDRGKWYTATGQPWVAEIGGQTYPSAREVPIGDDPGDGYGPPAVLVFTTESYQLAGPGSGIPVSVTTFPPGGGVKQVVTEIVYRKREFGGWTVHLAGNGRLLGWVTPEHDSSDYSRVTGWAAHVAEQAFRGSGPDDEGHVLDKVPGYLYGGTGRGSAAIAVAAKRDDAAGELLSRLHAKRAPALGYGRHYDVTAYDDPACPGYGQKWQHAGPAGPICPACGCEPGRIAQPRPRRRGDRYAGTVGYHLKERTQDR